MHSQYGAPGAPRRTDTVGSDTHRASVPPSQGGAGGNGHHNGNHGNNGTLGSAGAMVTGSELPVRFTASGSEYFRIWVVNLLLTFVTLGLYHPWARVRKLRYFYGNTWVGDHAFDFHGDPRRMLRGTLLVGVLFLVYSVAGQFSVAAGVLALVAVAAVWPALFQAALRFRLANTSWRGLRFQFTGSLAGAYKALLPTLLPLGVFLALTQLLPDDDAKAGDAATAAAAAAPVAGLDAGLAITLLAILLALPWMFWNLKRYQHGHYALGRVQTELRTGPGSFYLLFLKAIGVTLLAMAVTVVLFGVAGIAFGVSSSFSGAFDPRRGGSVTTIFLMIGLVAAGYLALVVVSNTYAASRLQNLVWNRTKSTEVRFESHLRLLPLMGVTLKNWLLIAVTLGLYWPFAAVASARVKLEAVTVHTRRPVEDLVGRVARAGETDAAGDAAGDLFGLEVGL